MNVLPILGALLFSAAPVQAFETYEEMNKACIATGETNQMCGGVAVYASAGAAVSLLCTLVSQALITPANAVEFWEEAYKEMKAPLWKEGAENFLKNYPTCPVKP